MISGATGAVAVIYVGMITLIRQANPEITVDEITQYIFATVILAGLIQIVVGLLRLGKFIRFGLRPPPELKSNEFSVVAILHTLHSHQKRCTTSGALFAPYGSQTHL